VYEERFEPLASALAPSAIAVGIAQGSQSCAKAGIVGYEQSARRVKLRARRRRGGTNSRAEVAPPETSHAKSAL
jgi:hypothetical protein